MSAVRASPVYFDPDGLRSIRDKLRDDGIQSQEISTAESKPRFIYHLRCTCRKQTFHILGFSVPNSSFVALIPQGRKAQLDLVFEIHDLLLTYGGLNEDDYRKRA